MYGLSNSYASLGRHAEALPLREAMVAYRKLNCGPEEADTLNSMNNLANTYNNLYRFADAVKLHEEVLAIRKITFGPDHPDTLNSMNNLAVSYSGLHRYQEACQLHEQRFELLKQRFGPDHPETLRTINNLASSYVNLGRHEDALKLREESLRLHRAKLGPIHSRTLDCMRMYAESLVGAGRGAEAVPIIDECIKTASAGNVYPTIVTKALELRLQYFAGAKDVNGCRETTRMWDNLDRTDADSLYCKACAHAVTAAVLRVNDPEQGDAEANQAMEILKRAVALGYRNHAHMTKDTDLNDLRDRPDFKQIMAELLATTK